MRYGPEHKANTRAKILAAAGRLFRRRGFHAAGVDAVMSEAGLTPGGFYTHFGSKEALLADALEHAAEGMAARLSADLEGLPESGPARAEAFVAFYLNPAHREAVEDGCPLAALISEVPRAGEPVRKTFEAALLRLAARISDDGPDRDRAFAVVSLCVGALGLARSVQDEALADRILEAARSLAADALAVQRPGSGSGSASR